MGNFNYIIFNTWQSLDLGCRTAQERMFFFVFERNFCDILKYGMNHYVSQANVKAVRLALF